MKKGITDFVIHNEKLKNLGFLQKKLSKMHRTEMNDQQYAPNCSIFDFRVEFDTMDSVGRKCRNFRLENFVSEFEVKICGLGKMRRFDWLSDIDILAKE